MTPEEAVRAYFAAYSDGRPDLFDQVVSPDYVDYGHTVPNRPIPRAEPYRVADGRVTEARNTFIDRPPA